MSKEEGEILANHLNFKFFEKSNKDGTNVKESSRELITIALSKIPNDIKPNKPIKKNKKTPRKLSKKKLKKRRCLFSKC